LGGRGRLGPRSPGKAPDPSATELHLDPVRAYRLSGPAPARRPDGHGQPVRVQPRRPARYAGCPGTQGTGAPDRRGPRLRQRVLWVRPGERRDL
jgi:hypothetical protein